MLFLTILPAPSPAAYSNLTAFLPSILLKINNSITSLKVMDVLFSDDLIYSTPRRLEAPSSYPGADKLDDVKLNGMFSSSNELNNGKLLSRG